MRAWARCSWSSPPSRSLYAILFPGILAVGALAKFVQGWFPTAMVAAAETIVMLTGGIDLAVGPMVSLGSVVAASTMQGPLGILGGVLAVLALGACVGAVDRRIRRDRPLSGDHRDARAFVRPARRGASHPSAARRLRPAVAVRLSRRQPPDRGLLARPVRDPLEALSGDALGHRPDRRRRQRRGRLPLGRWRHDRSPERLYPERNPGRLHRSLCRRADGFGRSRHWRADDAGRHRRRGPWRRRVPRRPGRHARRARRQPADERTDQRHVFPRPASGGAICRPGTDHRLHRIAAALPLVMADERS